jgi:AcrR family transcriptional regulator
MAAPSGPNPAVRDALLAAAVESYTSGGSFSVRQLAALAGVNVGQIHHYFGGKEGLRREMLHQLAAEQADTLEALPDGASVEALIAVVWRAAVEDDRFVRVLARQLVEHPDQPVPQSEFPVSRRMEAIYADAGFDDPKVALAARFAGALGFALFRPWLVEALDLDDDALARVADRLRALPTR